MSLKEWIQELRQLHDGAKKGKLSAAERKYYEDGRDQLARAMLSAQQLTLKAGEVPRRMLRVALALQVDLTLPDGRFRTPTLDLSSGGFGVLVPHNALAEKSIAFVLRLPGRPEGLKGEGRVVHAARFATNARASIAFEGMADTDREAIEMLVFDTALGSLAV